MMFPLTLYLLRRFASNSTTIIVFFLLRYSEIFFNLKNGIVNSHLCSHSAVTVHTFVEIIEIIEFDH